MKLLPTIEDDSMTEKTPHYLLFSESVQKPTSLGGHGRWHFVLEAIDGSTKIEASDTETEVEGERLELLAVVRGLEALDQPSKVTLITSSRYVSRGFRFGLEAWAENNWRWERFGRFVPVKNNDLWQRVDRALQFHQVKCRSWKFAHEAEEESSSERLSKEYRVENREEKPSPKIWDSLISTCQRTACTLAVFWGSSQYGA